MGKLGVIEPGFHTTLQDAGRRGVNYYGIPSAGWLDAEAACLANQLVQNSLDATLLECTLKPPQLAFATDALIAVTGADMRWQVNGQTLARHAATHVAAGSVVIGEHTIQGSRGYLAIAGTIQTESHFGSTSCYPPAQLGGNSGVPLAVGDTLIWADPQDKRIAVQLHTSPHGQRTFTVPMIPGPEFEWLTEESRGCLLNGGFRLDNRSNRMAAQLSGNPLTASPSSLPASAPVVPGIIQLPPHGNPIVLLNDCQTVGGYPRVGFLRRPAIDLIVRLLPGESVRFVLDAD